ncbi:ABC transporter substrate-binding protein [Corynebacterium casei]|uniref:ABC transporter substrate-binding protein n=1 Tax=Corynebacterium casei TaxID=160386 RepID=UPI0018686DCB|nr:ABC transporter substrate-binding protein [Corynebacterium casei]MDN5705751.1 ABC transporter substrate-binding protein [Corynebacterium casei]MDN5728485.1 ABC transporter substrate-binding protein [Corynebacterium casei]MDN5739922.1 ABC transporter substrate-binding protein [Corynebacterium casei]MDN5784383.1 ABC transporter substrate-binding protein [Corynebacterium casei]MDN5800455.1 ABC transporter substrate-binding protein [Corynebacterium casei]
MPHEHKSHSLNRLDRRRFLQLGALATVGTAVAGLAGCGTSASNGEPADNTPLTIGYVPIACSAPIAIADALGLFKKHGANVVLKKFSGWADLWTAYATEQLDVAHMLSPMTVAIDAGVTNAARPTELSFTQNTNGQAITLASKHYGSVNSAQDFKGMVLGIPFEYSVHALLLRDYLAANGVDPIADVELRLLRPADMVAQLSVEGIDGFIGPEPFNERAIKSGSGKIWLMTKQLWDKHPCCSVAMAKEWKAEHSSAAQGVNSALEEAAAILSTPAQFDSSAQTLSQEKYLNQPAELLDGPFSGVYQDWHGNTHTDLERMSFGDPTDPAAIVWMATQIARWGLGGDTLTMDDATIIKAAQSVLAPGLSVSGERLSINGVDFDPLAPTRGYDHMDSVIFR